ncbi:MAG: polysaccharide biosynthesis C-terminal domain-containing protein, partial [Rikenellaceae bacterium]
LRMACYVIFPIMIAMCVLAEPFIRVLLTDKWLPAVPLLQILCIAFMWDPVMKINHNILNVKGRSDYFLRAELIKKIAAIIILVITIPFGIKVMCIGLIAYSFADMLIIIYYTHKLTEITLQRQIKELLPIVALSFSMGGVMYLSSLLSNTPIIQILAGGAAGVIYYVALSHLFHFKEFKQILSIIKP